MDPAMPPETGVDASTVGPVTDTPTPEPTLNLRALIIKFVIGVLLLMAVLGVVGYFFREPLLRWSQGYVNALGGMGVFIGFFAGDAFTLPIPHDAFSAFGLVGGMGFWEVVAWASLGCLVGASLGYLIGRGLSHTRWFKRMMGRRGDEMHLLARRYGAVLLILGALTPLTYSVCVWAVSALGMRFRLFFAITLLRIPRVALYLFLIQEGILKVIGLGW